MSKEIERYLKLFTALLEFRKILLCREDLPEQTKIKLEAESKMLKHIINIMLDDKLLDNMEFMYRHLDTYKKDFNEVITELDALYNNTKITKE